MYLYIFATFLWSSPLTFFTTLSWHGLTAMSVYLLDLLFSLSFALGLSVGGFHIICVCFWVFFSWVQISVMLCIKQLLVLFQVLSPDMSLATVRTYIWKKQEDLVLNYRVVQGSRWSHGSGWWVLAYFMYVFYSFLVWLFCKQFCAVKFVS